jgi:hypothetical protein
MKIQLERHIQTICSLSRRLQENRKSQPVALTHPPPTLDRPLKGFIRVRMSGVVPSKAKSPNQHLTRTSNCYIYMKRCRSQRATASLGSFAN